MATPAQKEKKACKILDKWFLDPEISDLLKSNHSKNMKLSLHCLLCDKSVSIDHQGKLNLQRHCRGKSHVDLLNNAVGARGGKGGGARVTCPLPRLFDY